MAGRAQEAARDRLEAAGDDERATRIAGEEARDATRALQHATSLMAAARQQALAANEEAAARIGSLTSRVDPTNPYATPRTSAPTGSTIDAFRAGDDWHGSGRGACGGRPSAPAPARRGVDAWELASTADMSAGAVLSGFHETGWIATQGSRLMRTGRTRPVRRFGAQVMSEYRHSEPGTGIGRFGRSTVGRGLGRASFGVGLALSVRDNYVEEDQSVVDATVETGIEVGSAAAGAKVGAMAGFAVGGPVGAFAGGVIGGLLGAWAGSKVSERAGDDTDGVHDGRG